MISKCNQSDIKMRSPQRTDYDFSQVNYSLFLAAYIAVVTPLIKDEKLTFGDIRILAAVDSLMSLYDWRLNGLGVTAMQVQKMSSFADRKVKRVLARLTDRGLLSCDYKMEGKRKIYRYKLTKTGKTIVNKVTMLDKVHERIIEHLYKTRLLK